MKSTNPLRTVFKLFSILYACVRLSFLLLGIALWAITREIYATVSRSRRPVSWPEPWTASSFSQNPDSRLTVAQQSAM
jgi:hypothetical protein